MKLKTGLLVAAIAALFGVRAASAGTVTYNTIINSNTGASAAFTTVSGGLQVALTNTHIGTFSIGQGVSSIFFTVTGLSMPTAFTSLSGLSFNPGAAGTAWTSADGTAFSDTGAGPTIDHWGFSTSGTTVQLATAGSPVSGGKPDHLIFPTSGTVGPGGSLNGNHTPDIIGTATFFLAISGVTSSTSLSGTNITGVTFGFGTSPDSSLGGLVGNPPTPPGSGAVPTPLPAAVWGGMALMSALGVGRAIKRRRNVA